MGDRELALGPSSMFFISKALTSAVSLGSSVDLCLALATRRHCWKALGRMTFKSQNVQLPANETSLSVLTPTQRPPLSGLFQLHLLPLAFPAFVVRPFPADAGSGVGNHVISLLLLLSLLQTVPNINFPSFQRVSMLSLIGPDRYQQ